MILDKCGVEIQPGNYIVYGHAMGRCAGLRFGVVTRIGEPKTEYGETKVPIQVQGVDDDWNHRPPKLLGKKSTIFFPKRIVVIQNPPLNIKALLDSK